MHTPQDEEFDTIISKFNDKLFSMGPGIGDPVTRAERALLKTFWLFMRAESREPVIAAAEQERADQSDPRQI